MISLDLISVKTAKPIRPIGCRIWQVKNISPLLQNNYVVLNHHKVGKSPKAALRMHKENEFTGETWK